MGRVKKFFVGVFPYVVCSQHRVSTGDKCADLPYTVFLDWKGNQMAEKIVNYTPEMTAQMVTDYQAGITVERIAEGLNKTVRSVVAKLSREGVYQKKTYTTKGGGVPVKKDAHADHIGQIVGLSEGEVDSLTKANKTALAKIVLHLLEGPKV